MNVDALIFAPEIEVALIAIAWREPERLATIKRELDPAVHFIQPHCRYLLEAIDLAYGELNAVDFASVVQILREFRWLEDCGGLDGVNEVYCAGVFLDSPIWQSSKTDAIFDDYLALLKTYALKRALDPPCSVYRFTGGVATLTPNKVKRRSSEPDFIGEARICGRHYTVGASLASDGSFLNFRFEPKL